MWKHRVIWDYSKKRGLKGGFRQVQLSQHTTPEKSSINNWNIFVQYEDKTMLFWGPKSLARYLVGSMCLYWSFWSQPCASSSQCRQNHFSFWSVVCLKALVFHTLSNSHSSSKYFSLEEEQMAWKNHSFGAAWIERLQMHLKGHKPCTEVKILSYFIEAGESTIRAWSAKMVAQIFNIIK